MHQQKKGWQERLVEFFEKYKAIKYDPGKIILKPCKKIPWIYWVKNGNIRTFLINKNGEKIGVKIPHLFYISLGINKTNAENFYFWEACEPVEILMAPKKEFLAFINSDTEISENVTKELFNQFVDTATNIDQIIYPMQN